VAADPTPVPYAANLEAEWAPTVQRIEAAIEKVLSY
jgi:pyruvate/2-oxoglutarate/acetoin dehydrogenase E1 component